MKRIPVLSLASGDQFTVPVYDFKGTKRGAPSAYLQSAMHGSEVQGSLVLANLIEHLEKNPPLGNIRIVPNCNPLGLNNRRGEYTDGRYEPASGENWNRRYFHAGKDFAWDEFLPKHRNSPDEVVNAAYRKALKAAMLLQKSKAKSATDRNALQLQILSIDYDFCLDLHCANHSVRHLYTPDFAQEDAECFGIPFHLVMPPDRCGGSLDEIFFAPWNDLVVRRGQGHIPVQSFTVELGNHEEVSSVDAEKDLKGILSYLACKGVVKGKVTRNRPVRCPVGKYLLIPAPIGGIAEFAVPVGKKVKKGELIARILTFGIRPKFHEVRSPVDGVTILRHSSAIVNEGADLVKLFTVF